MAGEKKKYRSSTQVLGYALPAWTSNHPLHASVSRCPLAADITGWLWGNLTWIAPANRKLSIVSACLWWTFASFPGPSGIPCYQLSLSNRQMKQVLNLQGVLLTNWNRYDVYKPKLGRTMRGSPLSASASGLCRKWFGTFSRISLAACRR